MMPVAFVIFVEHEISQRLIGDKFLFWVVLLVAAMFALRVAGFGQFASWFDRLALYAPNLVVAFVVLVAGMLLGAFVREQIAPMETTTDADRQRTERLGTERDEC